MPSERCEDAWAPETSRDRSGRAISGLASTPGISTICHIDSAAWGAGSVADATDPQVQNTRRRQMKRKRGVRKVAGCMAEFKRELRSSQAVETWVLLAGARVTLTQGRKDAEQI